MSIRPLLALLAAISAAPLLAGGAKDEAGATLKRCAPLTYEAALVCLDTVLPPEHQARLAAPDGTVKAHFGLGMWIRNNWGLWQQGPLYRSMQTYGFAHPDDMSGAILEGFAARERGEPFDVATRAKEYRQQGEKMWNEAVKEGRAGSLHCPGIPQRSKDRDLEAIDAALEACADTLKKQLKGAPRR